MSACTSKCALSGGRVGFRVNMGSVACSPLWAFQKVPSARTRAGDHGHAPVCERKAFCVVQNNKDAMFALAPKGAPSRWSIGFPR